MKAAVRLLCLFLALGLCACEKDARYLDDKGNPLPDNEKMITAVLNRDLETVKKLHKSGVPLNLFDDAGHRTPLHWAAAMGEIEIMTYLLDNGVDPNIHDLSKECIEWWNTPLHETTYHGRIDAARLLLERGAKVETEWRRPGGTLFRLMWRRQAIIKLLCADFYLSMERTANMRNSAAVVP